MCRLDSVGGWTSAGREDADIGLGVEDGVRMGDERDPMLIGVAGFLEDPIVMGVGALLETTLGMAR